MFDLSNDFSEENLTECTHEKYSLLKDKFNNEDATDDIIDYRKLIPYIYELTGEIDPVHERIEDLNEYLEEMHTMLDKQYGQESNVSKKWEEYKELLKKVTNVKYSKWGYQNFENGKWIDGFHLDKCLEQSFPNDKTITYKKKMEKLIENMNSSDGMDGLPLAKRYFARIKDELLRGIQNRSKITKSISEIEKLNEKNICEPNREKVKELIREFRQLMNDRYNKATAYQHGCTFLDLCDYTNFDIHGIKKECIEIPKKIIKNLSKLSWVEFTNSLNKEITNSDSKLKEKFDTWMSAYKEFKTDKIDGLKEALNEYLDAINESLCDNVDEKNFIPSNSFPWNIYNTCDLEARKEYSKKYGEAGCYFIGGGSFEASEEGNEICILCSETNSKDGMVILRLRINKNTTDDVNLDTLLAPVCNPLNGGSDGLYDIGIKNMSLGIEWKKYLELMKERPEEFLDNGILHIETDPMEVEKYQNISGRTIGVVYSSPYHMIVVDLVYQQEGKYFAYERALPTIKKGAVVIVPQYKGGFLLLKQYRHALRDYQYAFPRGFGEEGISEEDNVCKEIKEELNGIVSDVSKLGVCVADSGFCGDKVSVFSCNVIQYSVNSGHEGISDVIMLSTEEIKEWIKSGKLNDGFTLSALSLLNI